jgi:hypothetical protein
MKQLSQKQCLVCGLKATSAQYQYYGFTELFSIYRVGYKDVCEVCSVRANSFVDYYGYKKQRDIDNLHRYLISGILPMRDYYMMMEGGYCEEI